MDQLTGILFHGVASALVLLVNVLIVVSVGGLESLSGPSFAALLLGISDTAFKYRHGISAPVFVLGY